MKILGTIPRVDFLNGYLLNINFMSTKLYAKIIILENKFWMYKTQ